MEILNIYNKQRKGNPMWNRRRIEGKHKLINQA